MSKPNIRPLHDKIVLELELERTTESGVIITALDPQQRIVKGKVVAVGTGRKENGSIVPMSVSVGDLVMFDKFAVARLEVDGEQVFIGSEADMVIVLDNAVGQE